MKRGADIIKIGREVNQELDVFENNMPSSVKINKITDLSKIVGDSVDSFLKEIIIAIVGVLLVVIVFYHSVQLWWQLLRYLLLFFQHWPLFMLSV